MKYSYLTTVFLLIFIYSCTSDSTPETNSNTTNIPCSFPTNISIHNGTTIEETSTNNTIEISWESYENETAVLLEYGYSGFEIGSGNTLTLDTNPYTLEYLDSDPNTEFDFYLKTLCGNNVESEFSNKISLTTPCSPNSYYSSLTLTSQEDIDEFGTSCYSWIGGTLIIDGENSNITSLAPLASLVYVSNSITIKNIPSVTSLNGLENLKYIENSLHIENTGISSLEELGNLTTMSHVLTLINNPFLTSLAGLQPLFNTQNYILEIYLKDNHALTSFDLNNVVNLDQLYIYTNDNLINLNGLEDLDYIQEIYIGYNASLNNYCGLQNVLTSTTNNVNTFEINDNLYNPTAQDIIDGNCQQ